MHQHTWRCTSCLLLTLPTDLGFADRVTTWICTTCPPAAVRTATITGHIRVGTPVHTPEWWDAAEADAARQERAHRDAQRQDPPRTPGKAADA